MTADVDSRNMQRCRLKDRYGCLNLNHKHYSAHVYSMCIAYQLPTCFDRFCDRHHQCVFTRTPTIQQIASVCVCVYVCGVCVWCVCVVCCGVCVCGVCVCVCVCGVAVTYRPLLRHCSNAGQLVEYCQAEHCRSVHSAAVSGTPCRREGE